MVLSLAACGLSDGRVPSGSGFVTVTPGPTSVETATTASTPVVIVVATATYTTQPATATPTSTATNTPTPTPCVPGADFIADVTIPDGTSVEPGSQFGKIWRVRNAGTCVWEAGYTVAFRYGAQLGAPSAAPIPAVRPGDLVDISLPMTAPTLPGQYQGTWRLRAPNGELFGPDLTVLIGVGPTPTPIPPPIPELPSCPANFANWPAAIANQLNQSGRNLTALRNWLKVCNVLTDNLGGVYPRAIQSSTPPDIVVVIHNLSAGLANPSGMLLVYHARGRTYSLAFQVSTSGRADLLTVEDLNADGRHEIVWTDTTCGAHTCSSTLSVERWSEAEYVHWIDDPPTTASASYDFADVTPEGSGKEILIHGGMIGSVGAGPQRPWTETYTSPAGGPYQLFSHIADPSPCLYHHILDANELFRGPNRDYDAIIAAYQDAINDPMLQACWSVPDELNRLRDFARFRLVLAYTATGQRSQAQAMRDAIGFPPLQGAADAFLDNYETSNSLSQACAATTAYAVANPASWDFLADWGYANPSFSAQELCPGFSG